MLNSRFAAMALAAVIGAPALGLAQAQAPSGAVPQTSLAQAIEAAEAAEADGIAVEAELEREDGISTYEITLAREIGLIHLLVDPATGEILDREAPSFGEHFAERAATLFVSLTGGEQQLTRGALAQAVERAETSTGARAIEAEVEDDGPVFEIELLHPERGRIEVTVDPQGNVLPDD